MKLTSRNTQIRRIAQKIFSHLDGAFMGIRDRKIGLAVSGGLDSRALLEAFARWPKRHEFDIRVLTVNHNTREESSKEAHAVYARALALGFESRILTVFCGPKRDEGTLRNYRYSALEKELQQTDCRILCTAHQKDDNAEGLFMDLFGFGGGKGGSGMSTVRPTSFGLIMRPFLHLERRDLLLFLTSIGVTDFFEDPSNSDSTCARQKARDFLTKDAIYFHNDPVIRFSDVATERLEECEEMNTRSREKAPQIKISPQMESGRLRIWLKERYAEVCPELDPRDAKSAIESILRKAKRKRLIGVFGVDQDVNSITVERSVEWKFDLPGAKALVTPEMVSLFRKKSVNVVE